MNQLTIADEVFNPFSQQTDSLDFYQVHDSLVSTDSTDYEHVFELDNKMQVSSRVRYSLWQALGDIGGFHDGLFMVVRFLIAPIAATFFHKEILQKDLTETKLTNRERQRRSKVAQAIIFDSQQTRQDIGSLLTETFKVTKPVKISVFISIKNCLCLLLRKRKGNRVI